MYDIYADKAPTRSTLRVATNPRPRWADPLDYQPHMAFLDDIAKSLSKESRYSNFLDIGEDEIYSVGQHSVYVLRAMQRKAKDARQELSAAEQRTLLAHDFSEYILKDVPTPLKREMPEYQRIEKDVQDVMYAKYECDISEEAMGMMHWADRFVLLMEMKQFGYEGIEPWVPKLFDYFEGDSVWLPSKARRTLLEEAAALGMHD